MYRLANIRNTLIQSFVTNEIIRGFSAIFHTTDKCSVITQEASDEFIANSDTLSAICEEHPYVRAMLPAKLKGMLDAMRDSEYEYTFDEFGEFLLYEMIVTADDMLETGMIDCWEPGGTFSDRRRLAAEILLEMDSGNDGEEIEFTQDDDEMLGFMVDELTHFPRLADELNEDVAFECIFWDTDFALYYKYDFDSLTDFMRTNQNCGFTAGGLTKFRIVPENVGTSFSDKAFP